MHILTQVRSNSLSQEFKIGRVSNGLWVLNPAKRVNLELEQSCLPTSFAGQAESPIAEE